MDRREFKYGAEGAKELFRFTEREDVSVHFVHTVMGDSGYMLTVVYYNFTGDLTKKEECKLTWIREKALSIATDEKFLALTNHKQRQFYLLERYQINSVDALDIIDYLAMLKKIKGE
jgi:hypothetical protein